MSYLSLFPRLVRYESVAWRESVVRTGVRFGVRRISLGRRLEFAAALRALAQTVEFAAAGESVADRACAKVAEGEIERLYLRWGLAGIEGLEIDGAAATTDSVFENGPEDLASEMLNAVKSEWALTGAERKNSSSHSIFPDLPGPDGSASRADGPGSRDGVTAGF